MLFSKKANVKTIDLEKPDPIIIQEAVRILATGGLVVYPTDTAYGLGVNAFDRQAVRKMYDLKERDPKKPTHVVVRDWRMIEGITKPTDLAKALHDKYMPGPITLILEKHNVVPDELTAGLPTLGVRIPDCKVTQAISQLLKNPYTTPSANREGGLIPYSIEEVLGLEGIDLVLDAGKLPPKPTSTIVNLTSENIKILREGEISSREILNFIKTYMKTKKFVFK